MKRILLGLSCLLCCGNTLLAQDHKWTLKECMDYAEQNSIAIQKTEAQTKIFKAEHIQQRAGYFPNISASTNHSLTYRPFQEGATGMVNGNVISSSAKKTSYNGSYGINVAWTVYNGNQTANNIKLSSLAIRQSQLQREIQANSQKEQLLQLFINILYTREALIVNTELLKQDSILYNRGKELLAQGQIAQYELLELQSLVANGKYDIVNTKTQIEQYKLQLKQLMNLRTQGQFDIAEINITDAQPLAAIPDIQAVYERAIALRPEITDADLGISQADFNYKIARAGYLPTLSMSAGLGDNHSNGNSTEWFEQMKRNFDTSIGFTISVPIFDGMRNKTSVQKAKINKTIALLDKQDTENNLYNIVSTYRLNAYNNQQKYIAGKEKLDYCQANYDAIFTKAAIGTMNIVETLNARATLLNAKQDVLQSKYTTIYNQQMLDFYAGHEINL